MKFGLLLHPERGIDAIFEEARAADRQGYDSIWLSDHLMEWRGEPGPKLPLDSLTLMTALGAVTNRTRLAWAMLNMNFRTPAVLAKMLATLDQVTHGRVICTVGAGWFKDEYEAYGLPFLDDHDERIAQAREAILLLKELWTHPAPDRVTFEGGYYSVHNLAFTPAPYQTPHPPIWFGGDSEATQALVRELADGWVMLRTTPESLAAARNNPEWPRRPMTLVRNSRVVVGQTHSEAMATVVRLVEQYRGAQGMPTTVKEFIDRFIVGTRDECVQQISAIESTGVNYLRLAFEEDEHQEQVALELIPILTGGPTSVATSAG
jgi:alkanesulfonate monooxygenase SsuD/methylene tetrahydromethanopterin reductase-like flavin-dependent oxidoreductase (luciferase family)